MQTANRIPNTQSPSGKAATVPRTFARGPLLAALLLFLCATPLCRAQILEAADQAQLTDSLRISFERGPYFTLFKDNYFLVGNNALGHKPTAENSDVKFQVSISQRLTKSTLPWHTFLFLAYTQKVTWDVFKRSMPMHDFSFNPAIGLSKPLYSKGRYIGKATLMIEHESNGRDSIQSRSWNKISLGAGIYVTDWLMVHGKVWIPIVDGENNRDIVKYAGLWQTGFHLRTPNGRIGGGLTLIKRGEWKPSFNLQVDFEWLMWRRANQYFYVQFYQGYGENMLDYNKFHRSLRVGILIKPRFFSEY